MVALTRRQEKIIKAVFPDDYSAYPNMCKLCRAVQEVRVCTAKNPSVATCPTVLSLKKAVMAEIRRYE